MEDYINNNFSSLLLFLTKELEKREEHLLNNYCTSTYIEDPEEDFKLNLNTCHLLADKIEDVCNHLAIIKLKSIKLLGINI